MHANWLHQTFEGLENSRPQAVPRWRDEADQDIGEWVDEVFVWAACEWPLPDDLVGDCLVEQMEVDALFTVQRQDCDLPKPSKGSR